MDFVVYDLESNRIHEIKVDKFVHTYEDMNKPKLKKGFTRCSTFPTQYLGLLEQKWPKKIDVEIKV